MNFFLLTGKFHTTKVTLRDDFLTLTRKLSTAMVTLPDEFLTADWKTFYRRSHHVESPQRYFEDFLVRDTVPMNNVSFDNAATKNNANL